MTLELKQYYDSFFNNSTEPYELGGVQRIVRSKPRPDVFMVKIYDTRSFLVNGYEYVKNTETGKYYIKEGKWVEE